MIGMKKHDIAFGIVLVLVTITKFVADFFNATGNTRVALVLVPVWIILMVLMLYIYRKYMRD